MKKNILYLLLLLASTSVVAQQMPFYSQYRSNMYMLNPGITGTKRLIDARINYRAQWVGYDDAPRTTSVSVNSRFMKGKMGAGVYMMQDNIGPSKQMNIGGSYAYHIRFPDCELSAGLAGNFTRYSLNGNKIFLHNTQDPAINQYITDKTWTGDMAAGIYLYNDRFNVGLSATHLMESTAEFYKADSTKKGMIKYVSHADLILGYNYSQNHDFIWETTLHGNYVPGAPFNIDLMERVHYKEKIFGGIGLRMRDALAIQFGMTFMEDFQVSYSYDVLIGKLRSYSSGTHEIMIVYSSNIFHTKKGKINDKFLHQRYGYLFD